MIRIAGDGDCANVKHLDLRPDASDFFNGFVEPDRDRIRRFAQAMRRVRARSLSTGAAPGRRATT